MKKDLIVLPYTSKNAGCIQKKKNNEHAESNKWMLMSFLNSRSTSSLLSILLKKDFIFSFIHSKTDISIDIKKKETNFDENISRPFLSGNCKLVTVVMKCCLGEIVNRQNMYPTIDSCSQWIKEKKRFFKIIFFV
jgi:hypothetical protein